MLHLRMNGMIDENDVIIYKSDYIKLGDIKAWNETSLRGIPTINIYCDDKKCFSLIFSMNGNFDRMSYLRVKEAIYALSDKNRNAYEVNMRMLEKFMEMSTSGVNIDMIVIMSSNLSSMIGEDLRKVMVRNNVKSSVVITRDDNGWKERQTTAIHSKNG